MKNTSSFAEQSIAPIRRRIQKEVYDYLTAYGPSTHQIMEAYFAAHYGPSTIRARCRELVKQGWVKNSGNLGKTKANRPTIIWQVT